MKRDVRRMRGAGPTVFANVTAGVGVATILDHIEAARTAATATSVSPEHLAAMKMTSWRSDPTNLMIPRVRQRTAQRRGLGYGAR